MDRAEYTEAEQWAWDRIQAGQDADFTGRADNTLRAGFIAEIATNAERIKELPRPRIVIKGAQITGALNLSDHVIGPTLGIINSTFDAGIDMIGAQFNRALSLAGSHIKGAFSADGISIGGDLFLSEKATFAAEVRLLGARITGQVATGGSTFQGAFIADRISVGGSLFLSDGATFAAKVSLAGAAIKGNLETDGSMFQGAFSADRISIGGNLFLRDRANFEQEVRLLGAQITGQVAAIGSTFQGAFIADRISIGGGLFLRDRATFEQEVRLLGAQITGQVDASESTFQGVFNADGISVGGELFLSDGATFAKEVRLLGARITGQVATGGSTFQGAFYADGISIVGNLFLRDGATCAAEVSLVGAAITGTVQLQGSEFKGLVDMTNAKLGDELMLSRPNKNVVWGDQAKLIVRNAQVRVLQASESAWQKQDKNPLPLDLVGFDYKRLGGMDANEHNTMIDAKPESLITWIKQGETQQRYTPQPYSHLAGVLRAVGMETKAKRILYAQSRHRDRTQKWTLYDRVLRPIQRFTVGYGVYPEWALAWFAGLVVVGFGVAYLSTGLANAAWYERFMYSLDAAIPLIILDYSFNDIKHCSLIALYFQFHRLFGLFLASILVGALTIFKR